MHVWKACNRQNRFAGSNPVLSAILQKSPSTVIGRGGFYSFNVFYKNDFEYIDYYC